VPKFKNETSYPYKGVVRLTAFGVSG